MSVYYCRKCVFPNTRPFLTFDDCGVCSACNNQIKKYADWVQREKEFIELVECVKSKRKTYDVVIPVSGGKDSIYQVYTALKYGLKVLAVSVDYGIKTDIGRHNLEIIPNMGVDLITFRPNQKLHKGLIRSCFLDWGDPDVFSHSLLYAYPMHVAKEKDIPLVLYGENPAMEYIGDMSFAQDSKLSTGWFYKYVINEVYYIAILSAFRLAAQELQNYCPPNVFSRTRFLGYYVPWFSENNKELALSLGFKTVEKDVGTYRNFVGIDEVINRVHQYMKLVVLGYGRATDHTCEDIRAGKMTRDQAVQLVLENDVVDLDESIKGLFCEHINISVDDFDMIVNRFKAKNKMWSMENGKYI